MTQTTRVEISCINIKLKKTDLVGERTATKYIQISYNNNNMVILQTKKNRNIASPPITADIFWSFPTGISGFPT